MHNHIRCRSVIGYMILTFDVTKCHFKSNKILCQVPESSLRMIYVNFHKPICPLWPFKNCYATVTADNSYINSSSSRSSSSIAGERHSLRALKHRPLCLAWPEGPASLYYIWIFLYIIYLLCVWLLIHILKKEYIKKILLYNTNEAINLRWISSS